VDEFLRNGSSLLEAANAVAGPAEPAGDMAILIGQDGSIRAVACSDWPLASLAAERGARMAYRVSHGDGRVRVEGRSGSRSLLLQSESPRVQAVLGGLAAGPAYSKPWPRIFLT
jgi:hypothetical protein